MHFTKHRGLATGLTIAGSSLGGVIWPIVDDQLLNHRGMSFGWTMRINGFIMIPLAIVVVIFVRRPSTIPDKATMKSDVEKTAAAKETAPSQEKPQEKKKADLSILKKPVFIFFVGGTSIFNLGEKPLPDPINSTLLTHRSLNTLPGMFSPFFFVTAYAVSLGHTASYAFYAVSAMNAASLFGRILIGMLADRFGAFNLTTFSAVIGAMICYCWTAATSEAGIMLWALAYGFSSGVSFISPVPFSNMLVSCHILHCIGPLICLNLNPGNSLASNAVCNIDQYEGDLWHHTGRGLWVELDNGACRYSNQWGAAAAWVPRTVDVHG